MKSTIEIPNAPSPVGPYSQAIKYNGLTIASGQIAIDPKTRFVFLASWIRLGFLSMFFYSIIRRGYVQFFSNNLCSSSYNFFGRNF